MPLCRLLAASLLAEGKLRLHHVPKLAGYRRHAEHFANDLGCRAEHERGNSAA